MDRVTRLDRSRLRNRRTSTSISHPGSPVLTRSFPSRSGATRLFGSHATPSPARARMRGDEFELGDGGHLDWLLATIKRIDGVYDAYRVVPGKGS